MKQGENHFKIALGWLVALHFFGFLGMHSEWMNHWLQTLTPFESFVSLTPLNLLVTCGILLSFHKDWNTAFKIAAIICFTVGFGVEVLGVRTGVIFGNYQYSPVFGFQLWDTPLLIGVNWLVLVYCSVILTQKLKANQFFKVALSAFLMLLMDFLIEPVAIYFNFWQWENDQVPILNYFAWYAISFGLVGLFFKSNFQKQNKIAPYIYGTQFLFFLAHNLVFNLT